MEIFKDDLRYLEMPGDSEKSLEMLIVPYRCLEMFIDAWRHSKTLGETRRHSKTIGNTQILHLEQRAETIHAKKEVKYPIICSHDNANICNNHQLPHTNHSQYHSKGLVHWGCTELLSQ